MKTCLTVILFVFLHSILIAADIPKNAHPNIFGTGWDCDRGYYKSGQQCIQVMVPENAHIDVYGSGWDCDRGYYKSGQRCEKVIVPENAHINIYGNGWDCNQGYKKSINSCVLMTEEEIQKQKEMEETILKTLQERKLQGVSGDDCETEYKTNAEVCVKITGADLNCNKSFSGDYYRDCDVDLSYIVKTDYAGGAYLDVDVECTVEIEYKGRQTYITQSDTSSESNSHSLDAYDSDSHTMNFNFSFSSFKEITRVRISSADCKIENIELE